MQQQDKLNTTITNIVLVAAVAALLLGVFFSLKNQDIRFCQRSFTALVKGRPAVQKHLDWENFQAVGVDVGATYSAFSSVKEKADYKKAFIENFSRGFNQVGGKFRSFINWRRYDSPGELVVVAADYKAKGKTLLFTLSKGRRKLVAIDWAE